MTLKGLKKYSSAIASIKYQCKNCGRKMLITRGKEKVICDYCGHVIYKNEQAEFKDKLKKEIINLKKHENII